MSNSQKKLTDVKDSVLIIIDIQDSFLNKYDQTVSRQLLTRSEWIIRVANALNVPIIAMGEDTTHDTSFNKTIEAALPDGTKVHNKNTFSMASQPEIYDDFISKNRNTAILIGMETDVCVCQSALELIEYRHDVVVLEDATATMSIDQAIGINRMRDAGVAISSVKGIYYEWTRSVTNIIELMDKHPNLETVDLPSDLVL